MAFEMHAKLILPHLEDEAPASVVLRDISLEGAGLFHSRNLDPGMQLLLQLPSIHETTITIHAHVVQSRQLEPGRYRIGLQFDAQSYAALDRLRNALLM
jgi:c-di-GMP-binding flagellar brake protein YcgR